MTPPDESRARAATAARSLPAGVARFIHTEVSGGVVLLAAAVVALVWANSPWHAAYESLWHTRAVVEVGSFRFDEDLRHVVNDGLMALFFFVVGLETKREFVTGELSDLRVAALPVFGAVGGMVVPAVLYRLVAGGDPLGHGWGIPMATDIAFVLGIIALFGSRLPSGLKLFALTLAVVDDVGAIVVIALFYGDAIDATPLLIAAAGVAITAALRRARVDWTPAYVALGVATWYALFESGVHATIAGVALALVTPTSAIASSDAVHGWAGRLTEKRRATDVHQLRIVARESVSPAEYLEALLHPTVSFLVLPLFALANAGVTIRSSLLDHAGATRLLLAVSVGLVAGKTIGILGGAWIGHRLRLAALPAELTWRHIAGAASLGGVGFTVSLFVTNLAFDDRALVDAGRLAVLGASVCAAALGSTVLVAARLRSR